MSIWTGAEAQQDGEMRPRSDSGAVSLRPHHVMCAIGWQGRGYSAAFTDNMNAVVMDRLRADHHTRVVFTGGADAICGPCPSRRGTGCRVDARIGALDARHGAALGIAPGDEMTWAEAEARAARLQPGDLQTLCAGCRWLELDLCAPALARLKAQQETA